MKAFLIHLFIVIYFVDYSIETVISYRNHKVVSFKIENEHQLQEIQNLELQPGFVFWDPPVQVNMKLELIVHPEAFSNFEEMTENFKIDYQLLTDDLQTWIDDEKPQKRTKEGFSFEQFNTLAEIYQYLDEITTAHADIASIITIGESFEGRPLQVVKISTNENNPAIFIEANIHAREWISSATALWLINEFITSTDPTLRETVDSISWYILPVTNPDGFLFTHEVNRLWRKTRSNHNIFCRGVDPNRNFGYNWRMGGSSKVACTDTYMGPAPFSEKETKAVMDFYATIADKAEAYIAFHCAAETLLYPMGHDNNPELLYNVQDIHDIAEAAVDALKVKYNTTYTFGNTIDILYVASGSSPDHAYGVFNTPLAYTYEFRAGRGTPSRFILPPEEIVPNSEEILDSLMAFITKARSLGYFNAEV